MSNLGAASPGQRWRAFLCIGGDCIFGSGELLCRNRQKMVVRGTQGAGSTLGARRPITHWFADRWGHRRINLPYAGSLKPKEKAFTN